RQLMMPPAAVFEMAPAKVLHGAVRLHGDASSPVPENQVRVCACAVEPQKSGASAATAIANTKADCFLNMVFPPRWLARWNAGGWRSRSSAPRRAARSNPAARRNERSPLVEEVFFWRSCFLRGVFFWRSVLLEKCKRIRIIAKPVR